MSLLYRQLVEKRKEYYEIKLLRDIRHRFINLRRKAPFVHKLIYAIVQHQATDDIHHYLADCTTTNFLDVISILLQNGYLDILCLDSCYQYVLGRGLCPPPHEYDMSEK